MSVDQIKKLRDETGLSFGEIKKALDEADGDEARAREILNELGDKMAAKKSERQVKEGIVDSYIHNNKKIGALVEVLCETDFVARNDDFKSLAHDIAMHIAAMKPADVSELLEQSFIKDPSITIKDLVNRTIAKIGENIQIGRFQIFEV